MVEELDFGCAGVLANCERVRVGLPDGLGCAQDGGGDTPKWLEASMDRVVFVDELDVVRCDILPPEWSELGQRISMYRLAKCQNPWGEPACSAACTRRRPA